MCSVRAHTLPCIISLTLYLPYKPSSHSSADGPSEHPEKHKQAASHPPIQGGGQDFLRPWESMDLLGVQGSGDCQSADGRDLGHLLPLGSDVASSSRGPIFFPGAHYPAPESTALGDATQGACSSKNKSNYRVQSQTVSGSSLGPLGQI